METHIEEENRELLRQLLLEQKATNALLKANRKAFAELEEKVQAQWVQEQGNQPTPEIDLQTITGAIERNCQQLQSVITSQLQKASPAKRILLFPEEGAREYYRIVFGRFFFWMFVFLLSSYVFALGKQAIAGWENVKMKEAENNRYQKAWKSLYEREGKQVKRRMDSLWVNYGY